MKKIRIENTVGIIWQIKKDGTDHDMSGHTIKLWLYNSLTGDLLVPDFTVSKSVVTFLFAGDKQRYTGVYSLKLQDTTDGFSTIDTDAFELVTRSALADGSDGNITTETVQLTSEMQMAIKGDNGDSAYTVAVRGGFSGTEAEWLASLKGDKGDAFVYSDFTEDQILNLQKPAADAASDADAQTELCKTATDAAVKAKIEIEANELNRKAAEDARKAAELEREANEALRKSTEEQRDAAEEQRKDAETARGVNEDARKTAELARVAELAALKAASEAATTSANNAATLSNGIIGTMSNTMSEENFVMSATAFILCTWWGAVAPTSTASGQYWWDGAGLHVSSAVTNTKGVITGYAWNTFDLSTTTVYIDSTTSAAYKYKDGAMVALTNAVAAIACQLRGINEVLSKINGGV